MTAQLSRPASPWPGSWYETEHRWDLDDVATLAEAAAAMEREDWLEDARKAGAFLIEGLRRDDGRWLRSWQRGQPRHLAYAADHAALVAAFSRMAEATGEAMWIDEARATADAILDLFLTTRWAA